jgi:hypothetical protein
MKKLLFTAVAIVAFSGVSIANTIADEDVVKENKEAKVVQKIMQTDTECLMAKFVAYNDSRRAGFSEAVSIANSYSIYFTCMGITQLQ